MFLNEKNINKEAFFQYKLFDNFYRDENKLSNEKMKKNIEDWDKNFMLSNERKKNKWKVKDIVKRTIKTVNGVITYKRRRYVKYCKITKNFEYKYFADENFGINKYENVIDHLKHSIM